MVYVSDDDTGYGNCVCGVLRGIYFDDIREMRLLMNVENEGQQLVVKMAETAQLLLDLCHKGQNLGMRSYPSSWFSGMFESRIAIDYREQLLDQHRRYLLIQSARKKLTKEEIKAVF